METPTSQQPKKYLEIKPEDLERVERARRARRPVEVDEEWLAIAEFGKHFGWGAIVSVLNNEIDVATMTMLLAGARKVDLLALHDSAQAALIGVASANSKSPSQTFKSATAPILRQAKADA